MVSTILAIVNRAYTYQFPVYSRTQVILLGINERGSPRGLRSKRLASAPPFLFLLVPRWITGSISSTSPQKPGIKELWRSVVGVSVNRGSSTEDRGWREIALHVPTRKLLSRTPPLGHRRLVPPMESAKDELHTERLFASFGRQKDLSDAQATLLAVNLDVEPTSEENRKETELSYRFLVIVSRSWYVRLAHELTDRLQFAEYQEQPYLVDPFLEDLISPIVQVLKAYAIRSVNNKNNPMVSERVYRLTLLLYNYVKFRGYKTISQ